MEFYIRSANGAIRKSPNQEINGMNHGECHKRIRLQAFPAYRGMKVSNYFHIDQKQ